MFRIVCLLIGYGIGCISMGFIVGKLTKTDLREKGSGNLGTTNALRVLGFKAGVSTFFGDILKCVVAFVICTKLFDDIWLLPGIYASVGAVLGHDFPFYLKFKGGKGIAATIGMMLCLGYIFSPWLMLITFVIGIICVAASGYISVGSMGLSVSIPIFAFIFSMPIEGEALLIALTLLALWRHRENIKRLRAGCENKFTLHKSV